MKLIVCGGRHYKNKEFVYTVLNELHKDHKTTMIVAGDATGADSLAINWAKDNNIDYKIYVALWDIHGKAAGPIRNKLMITEHLDADFLLAFPGGNGTMNAIRTAKENNVPVIALEKE